MKKQEGFLDSSDGKNKLHVIRWLPDQESPNVWVQLVHGMNEHMGRYEEFAAYLAEHGITKGTEAHAFSPTQPVTVQQWAVMLCRTYGLEAEGNTWAELSQSSTEQVC